MAIISADSSALQSAFFAWPLTSISRSATDLTALLDVSGVEVVRQENDFETVIARELAAPTFVCRLPGSIAAANGWLAETLRLARYAELEDRLIVSVEAIAFHLAAMPFAIRPTLFIDDEGVPGFSTVSDSFYLNLTIDSPTSLTLYSVAEGRETFAGNARFDARTIPVALKELVASVSGRPLRA